MEPFGFDLGFDFSGNAGEEDDDDAFEDESSASFRKTGVLGRSEEDPSEVTCGCDRDGGAGAKNPFKEDCTCSLFTFFAGGSNEASIDTFSFSGSAFSFSSSSVTTRKVVAVFADIGGDEGGVTRSEEYGDEDLKMNGFGSEENDEEEELLLYCDEREALPYVLLTIGLEEGMFLSWDFDAPMQACSTHLDMSPVYV